MTFDSLTAVRRLQTLERQLAECPRHDEALRAAWTRGDREAARRATALAERHLRAMAGTTGALKARVVCADALGALESVSELALRAARLVVLTELDTLCALLHAFPEEALPRPLSWGRFRGLADLTSCVRAELDRILDPCRTLRERPQSDRPAYRAALRGAHARMRWLGTASEFARFLWQGRGRTDWPPLHTLCIFISIALTVRIDVEPDAALLLYAWPHDVRATERAS